jgi:hypothetical protein
MACSKQTLTNTGTTEINFNYRRCDNSLWEYQVNLQPNKVKNIWCLDDTFEISPSFVSSVAITKSPFPVIGKPKTCICKSYTITNNSLIGITTVTFYDCNKNLQNATVYPNTGISLCACNGAIITNGGSATIIDLGSCGSGPTPTPTRTLPSREFRHRDFVRLLLLLVRPSIIVSKSRTDVLIARLV